MTSQVALSVNDIHVRYGEAEVLRGVNVKVSVGEAVTLIGANGAGKTTLLKTISGMLRPVQGTIMFGSEQINSKPAYQIRHMGVVHVPEGGGILRDISVYENLLIGGYGDKREERMKLIESMFDRFPILKERRNQLGGSLSGGERQILAIVRGLVGRPHCFMLDEPSLGLAPFMISEVFRILKSIKEMKTTLLLVEQNAKQALELADRAYVMEVGRIIAEGSTEKILHDKEIIAAYLGV
jgi:branched-chain amino acid transport system ATP-binding protein